MGASEVLAGAVLQSLWSGYGEIKRYALRGTSVSSVVVKHICPPDSAEQSVHSRGWNSQRSHQRKLKSYQVEVHWYQDCVKHWPSQSRLPHVYACFQAEQQSLILLEDLDAAGFSRRCRQLDLHSVRPCLQWLAYFHAHFLIQPDLLNDPDLWSRGSYWHLQTRPDEWGLMPAGPLKHKAEAMTQALQQAPQTLLHGDAKLANFCFSPDLKQVVGLDFQYVGKGCGMQDLAYLLRSCLPESSWEALIPACIDFYFAALQQALAQQTGLFESISEQWRPLFSVAWADFLRFLLGWQPGFDSTCFTRFDRMMVAAALGQLE